MLPFLPLLLGAATALAAYTPDWPSIDSRPLPGWFDDVKFGIFCHWGVYSVPAYRSEWFWWYWQGDQPDKNVVDFVNRNYKPGTTYADFAREFTANFFNATHFRDIVEASGAKYFVLTSKHHEGFTMWPSPTSWNWNAKDTGPHRDLVGELHDAFTGSPVHFGLYFSHLEWFHPYYKSNITKYVEQVSFPQLHEIVEKYEPDVIWADGDWGATPEQWRAQEFLAWLYNESPVKDKIVVNDRWGNGAMGNHGGFLTYADHYDPGKILTRKWENCMTLDEESWGYREGMTSQNVHPVHYIIEQLARTVSCGGNLLLNLGPDSHGQIPAIFEDRLRELGRFLAVNEEALYGTAPAQVQNDTGNTWYTKRKTDNGTTLYAWILDVTQPIVLKSIEAQKETTISVLANGKSVPFTISDDGIHIDVTPLVLETPRNDVVILKFDNVKEKRYGTTGTKRNWLKYYQKYLRTQFKPHGPYQ